MPTPDSVKRLVDNFATHLDHYTSSNYNETEVRREFLDPFWKALGWDIDNERGYADAYKDVIHEDAIKIGGFTKAPDYCFRIGGTRKFFLEAKKPSIDVKEDIAPAYQLRRYAWSGKLPLSVLSDFEEFAVYDCRSKPKKLDKASMARTIYCTFDQYEDKWDEIEAIFSRDAVLRGSFDKYVETSKKKRGTAEVDDAFLEEIERWRDLLARNFALRNPDLSVRDLNYAVQKTIDRLIFLRICEDRGTEDYGRLRTVGNGNGTYPRLLELFRRADDRYNSGLFHFCDERGRPGAPDQLTPGLQLDDKVVKDILKNLYYPESPYEFSVLPADILGQVYEQFLGKTIRLTAGHQAKIEEKPEVRKAGGVFYTPKYIVDYIVENTLGRLLNGSDPVKRKPIAVSQAEKIKVLDPACGSGSFLIVAYQYLLDWHRDQYTLDPTTREEDEGKIKRHASGKSPKIYQARGGEWRLTTSERKRILLNNIHGLDIDSQAVEVTKLSLLLKVLEGETQQQLQRDFIKERQRILPDLGYNIRCGNSLIGPDFYDQPDLPALNDETRFRINVFDWEHSFSKVFEQGGFDCVIGNPPYIFTRELFSPSEKQYYANSFRLGWEKQNTFMLFMETVLRLVSNNGLASFIVPNSWLTVESAKLIRKEYVKKLIAISDLNYLVFRGVSMEPSIFIFGPTNASDPVRAIRASSSKAFTSDEWVDLSRLRWSAADNYRITIPQSEPIAQFLDDLVGRHSKIGKEFDVRTGLQAYERGKGTPPQSAEDVKNHVFDCWEKIDDDTYRYLAGKDVSRYQIQWSGMWMRYGRWLSQPREIEMFKRPRLLIREITSGFPKCLFASYCLEPFLSNKSVLTILESSDSTLRLMILNGVINSRLISLFYKNRAVKSARKVFPKVVIRNLREFPYPAKSDSKVGNAIAAQVDSMLKLHENQALEKNPDTLRRIEDDIAATDHRIDRLVYKLYGLTEDEISLVESAN